MTIRWPRLLVLGTIAIAAPLVVAWLCARFASYAPVITVKAIWGKWFEPMPLGFPEPDMFSTGASGLGVEWSTVGKLAMDMKGETLESTSRPGTRVRAVTQVRLCAGWPFRSFRADLHGEESIDASGATQVGRTTWYPSWRAGLSVGGDLALAPPGIGRSLPVLPLWPGLIADVAISLAVVMPLPLFFEFRRWHRWQRGRCILCGQQLLQGQCRCPECGSQVAAGERTASADGHV